MNVIMLPAVLVCVAMLIGALGPARAKAASLEADLTTHNVAVQSDFTGVKVLLFGATIEDKVEALDGPRDIIVVLHGPERAITVRRKKRVAGIWTNGDPIGFTDVPGFYAIAASRAPRDIADSYELLQSGIGLNTLKAEIILSSEGFAADNAKEYAEAIVRINTANGLYQRDTNGVQFISRHLFRAEFDLPAQVPLGDYKADVYVFRAGKMVRSYSTHLTIEKRGVEKMIYNLAHRQSFLYGVLAVASALLAGLGAATIFRKT